LETNDTFVRAEVYEFCLLTGEPVAKYTGDIATMVEACDETARVLGVPLIARKVVAASASANASAVAPENPDLGDRQSRSSGGET
jgi:hypothetical protein